MSRHNFRFSRSVFVYALENSSRMRGVCKMAIRCGEATPSRWASAYHNLMLDNRIACFDRVACAYSVWAGSEARMGGASRNETM